jgi:hypothetical protein
MSTINDAYVGVLYIGDVERGRAFTAAAERGGWHVFLPADLLEALGMYLFYYPQVIIIDSLNQPLLAAQAYQHLRSVQAAPIIRLTDAPGAQADERVYHVSLLADHQTILAAAREVLAAQPAR